MHIILLYIYGIVSWHHLLYPYSENSERESVLLNFWQNSKLCWSVFCFFVWIFFFLVYLVYLCIPDYTGERKRKKDCLSRTSPSGIPGIPWYKRLYFLCFLTLYLLYIYPYTVHTPTMDGSRRKYFCCYAYLSSGIHTNTQPPPTTPQHYLRRVYIRHQRCLICTTFFKIK